MAINTTNFSEAMEPLILEWYGATYNQHPEIFSRVYDVKTTNKKYEYLHSMADFPLVPVKPEGSPISFVDSKQGYKTTITQVTYALGFPVTLEMMKFNMYNLIEAMSRALGASMKQTIETVSADLYNNGFDSDYVFADGKELFATDHPKLYGGTWQNEPTNPVGLSMDGLEQAKLDINDYPTDRGLLMAARPTLLHIPPELEWRAMQLLGSAKDPESANNAINPAKGMMPYVVNPYLTDPAAWFVKTTIGNGTQFFWSQKPEHTMDNDTDSLNLKKKVHAMFAVSCGDPRSWYASPGV